MLKKLNKLLVLSMVLGMLTACGGSAGGVTHTGTIYMQDGGKMEFELYGDVAPETVENFVNLANDYFYDGIIFHRVIESFMIQGGDPEGTGLGGSGNPITGEFTANGHENDITHERGVMSMARQASNMDSASSQFFIMHDDGPYLDGQYAAFGRITSGLDVLDQIASVETNISDKPVEDVVIRTIVID